MLLVNQVADAKRLPDLPISLALLCALSRIPEERSFGQFWHLESRSLEYDPDKARTLLKQARAVGTSLQIIYFVNVAYNLMSIMFTDSWQPYVQNYAPNPSFDYGSRAAALWLER